MPLFRGDPGRKGPPHHSPIERDNLSVLIFLTVCTKDRKPRLASPEAHRVLKEWWNKAGAWLVGRYVILPDHVHLFCAPVLDVPLEKWCRASVEDWQRALVATRFLGYATAAIRQLRGEMGVCARHSGTARLGDERRGVAISGRDAFA